MKKYGVMEIFPTLQGEGANSGRPAVFIRFSGCNLGYDVCTWCDTDWVKPTYVLTLSELLERVSAAAKEFQTTNGLLAVITGGEPSLQLDLQLSDALRSQGYTVAMETNGSRRIQPGLVDWLTVSPKQVEYVQKTGDELKLVFTGQSAPGIAPDTTSVRAITADSRFAHYFLQPVDLGQPHGANYDEVVSAVMELGYPWRLALQTHKVLGLR